MRPLESKFWCPFFEVEPYQAIVTRHTILVSTVLPWVLFSSVSGPTLHPWFDTTIQHNPDALPPGQHQTPFGLLCPAPWGSHPSWPAKMHASMTAFPITRICTPKCLSLTLNTFQTTGSSSVLTLNIPRKKSLSHKDVRMHTYTCKDAHTRTQRHTIYSCIIDTNT